MNIQFGRSLYLSEEGLFGPETQEISSIAYNSADVIGGSAFFCIIGENTDGHLFIAEAIDKGAVAIIGSDLPKLKNYADKYPTKTFVAVEDSRQALAQVSGHFSGRAQDQLVKVGVTGTNGKTTTATYVYNLFNLLGISCGFLGTTGIYNSAGKLPYKKSTPTTPLSSDIHQIFSQLVSFGDRAAAMEVSSIALDQKRVEGILFDVAIHTNISEEHLEYHQTFEHYLECKLRLFKQTKNAVINLDDQGMAKEILAAVDYPALTYSQKPDSGAGLIWTDVQVRESGMQFDLQYLGQTFKVEVPLFGEYNAGNLTAAIGAALLSGSTMEQIISVLPRMPQVEGRFQLIEGPEDRKIILDYAHTPVALDLVMREVKKLPHNRLIALIAGIGIRDFSKMPKMAKAAEGKADVLVVTVDHPGFNDPNDVVNEVLKGFTVPYKQQVLTAPTRHEAVVAALQESGPNDIVLLSSGCINGAQNIRGEFVPHSDEDIIAGFFLQQN
ncbi:UDP-N-acetylmuramoyl-L-alanyl-D-glutamate--2,6-diaminopimelate ligase [Planococcus shenhongbingii]|uniref:UDP-N-acetylmuramoyl-L-alanyl-D-glutamate--2, 6-diaminopimelate ligase n=1 Tax=Planococcus shenhongbingii TaxID=3058398 RepID=A0ABT8NFJ4_9BACL|nr:MULTISPECIES: UDP-N-acetylmuramoyl-L-alanyl-D-glutamate--2,6-diaminopimelate ligase [unclassified Planococcus (in: firmicutes)]MDN7246660.1 UDP-N-acetylmuramoyl-L-alanyl-D-glutamate--2,6-diaminopimelate ligase [Planococcus sp. N017]WKA58980.1 UDP-N-acetylmuramoyl-L-alanyl-D-glutamate--2,6-diaminopimelate ligase [Planococcus sp. N016]